MGATMSGLVVLLPTGGEILDGTVLDTNSPELLAQLLRHDPACRVLREAPLADSPCAITGAVRRHAENGASLILLTGGSGGGHCYSATLAEDHTWAVLEGLLTPKSSHALYGKNGHLWCKLVCGLCGECLVANLPGPFVEAREAMAAFLRVYSEAPDNTAAIVRAMGEAVRAQYGGFDGRGL